MQHDPEEGSAFVEQADHPVGDQVVGTDKAGDGALFIQQLLGRLISCLLRIGAVLQNAPRGERDAPLLQRVQKAPAAHIGGEDPLRSGQIGKGAVPHVQQIVGHCRHAVLMVDAHADAVDGIAPVVHKDQRHPAAPDQVGGALAHAVVVVDDARYVVVPQIAEVAQLLVLVVVGVAEHHAVAAGGGHVLHTLEQQGVELVYDVGHHHADGIGALCDHAAGYVVGLVAVGLYDLLDVCAGLPAHSGRVVVDHAGDGGRGNSGNPGNILDGHRLLHLLPPLVFLPYHIFG